MYPRRIISLAPTHTEILYFLGAEDRVIGVTENCDYPEEVLKKETFGSWAYPDISKILNAKPDLVCTFSNHQIDFARMLRDNGIEVFHADPPDVKMAIEDIRKLGNLLQVDDVESKVESLLVRLHRVNEKIFDAKNRPQVFRIMNWAPLVTVGNGAFQNDVIRLAGGKNIFGDMKKPYFNVSLIDVKKRDPEVIFFCEQELKERILTDPSWETISAVRKKKIYCFPCGFTCRSGPRIVDMVEGLARVLHPGLFTKQ